MTTMKIRKQISFLQGLGGSSILAVSLIIIVISLILNFFFTTNQNDNMRSELIKRSEAFAKNLVYNSQYGVIISNTPGLQQLIKGVMNERDIIYAYIVDQYGLVIGHSDTTEISTYIDLPYLEKIYQEGSFIREKIYNITKESIIEINSPIEIKPESSNENEELLFSQERTPVLLPTENSSLPGLQNETFDGMVFIGISTQFLNEAISEIQRKAFLITLGSIVFGILLTIVLIKFVTNPIRKLMEATEIVAQGNLDHIVPIDRKDEIGILAQSFNSMTTKLNKSRKEIENWNKDLEKKVVDRTKELSKKHKELTESSKQLRIAYDELKTLDKSKDNFLALVSHELRTPLSSIVAYTEVLLDDMAETKEDEKKYLGIIKNESDRLTKLINDVLNLSKMEAGRMPFDFRQVKLHEIINTSVEGLSGAASKRNLSLVNNLQDSTIKVFADKDKIVQVLTNILSNAIKFTPEKGVITISGNGNKNMAQVSISDTGYGIKKKDYNKVFDKFRQIEDVEHHSKGTGLGMPISKLIIENHNGKIWIESVLKKGSTFYFTLPLK